MKKFICGLFSVFVLFFAAAPSATPSMADEMLRVGDATITYSSGYIDPVNLNGKARDVLISTDQGDDITIDQYELKTRSKNGQTIIDRLNFSGLVIADQRDVLAIQSIKWSGLVLPIEQFDINMLELDDHFLDQVENFGSLSISDVDFFENNQQSMHIDDISFDSRMVDIPILPNVPIQDVEITIDNMVVAVNPEDEDREFLESMERLGLKEITINANISSVIDVETDRVNNSITTAFDIEGMGRIELDLNIGMLNSSLQILNAAVKQPDAVLSDEMVGLMFTGGMFNDFRLMIEDDGLLNLFLDEYAKEAGISRAEVVNELMDQLAINLGSFAPTTFAMVAADIRAFLDEGGSLTFAFNPPSPTVLSSFLGFAAVPDTAATALGLTVVHER